MFLKIVYNSIVIDILDNPKWVVWAKRSARFVETDPSTANGIVASDGTVYHLAGRDGFDGRNEESKSVIPMEIQESEFNSLKSQIVDKAVNSNGEEVSIQALIEDKISEMSQKCEEVIMHGFDIVLSDGISHHFSLQIPDQLKISKLNDRAKAGESFLPYHADNEPCKVYSAEDIMAINTTMETIIEFQTTYFNSLKMYINSMTSKDDIINVRYGIEIPEGYHSEVLTLMLSTMGGEE